MRVAICAASTFGSLVDAQAQSAPYGSGYVRIRRTVSCLRAWPVTSGEGFASRDAEHATDGSEQEAFDRMVQHGGETVSERDVKEPGADCAGGDGRPEDRASNEECDACKNEQGQS